MSKLLLLFLTVIFGLVFVLLPNTGIREDFFLFADMKLSLETHLYFICEHFVLIILSYIIYNEATEYKNALFIFFLLMVGDMVDYCLTYNGVWFRINEFPISMNIVKAFLFGGVILNEGWKKLTK